MVPYYAELSLAQYLLRPEVRRPRASNVTPVLWEYNPLLQKNNTHQERLFFFFFFLSCCHQYHVEKKKKVLFHVFSLCFVCYWEKYWKRPEMRKVSWNWRVSQYHQSCPTMSMWRLRCLFHVISFFIHIQKNTVYLGRMCMVADPILGWDDC